MSNKNTYLAEFDAYWNAYCSKRAASKFGMPCMPMEHRSKNRIRKMLENVLDRREFSGPTAVRMAKLELNSLRHQLGVVQMRKAQKRVARERFYHPSKGAYVKLLPLLLERNLHGVQGVSKTRKKL